MRRTVIACFLIGSAFGHEHLRTDPSRSELEDVIASVVTRMEAMEAEIAELKSQRHLQNECGFSLQDDDTCKLARTLVLEAEDTSQDRDVSLQVKGITLLENEVEVLGDATFQGNARFEGTDNDVEVQGDLAVIGNLEVFGVHKHVCGSYGREIQKRQTEYQYQDRGQA
jgi:hypothetical protein